MRLLWLIPVSATHLSPLNRISIQYLRYTDQNIYFQVYNSDDKYLSDLPNATINIPNYR